MAINPVLYNVSLLIYFIYLFFFKWMTTTKATMIAITKHETHSYLFLKNKVEY